MGAESFVEHGTGSSAQDAFNKLVSQAQYEHGHGGYTGSIAEKSSFVMEELPPGQDPEDWAWTQIQDCIPQTTSKWGPCGCIHVPGTNKYVFFGTASS